MFRIHNLQKSVRFYRGKTSAKNHNYHNYSELPTPILDKNNHSKMKEELDLKLQQIKLSEEINEKKFQLAEKEHAKKGIILGTLVGGVLYGTLLSVCGPMVFTVGFFFSAYIGTCSYERYIFFKSKSVKQKHY